MAEQQGRYLARYLNAEARALEKGDNVEQEPFKYRQLGAMASVGAAPCSSTSSCAFCSDGAAAAARHVGPEHRRHYKWLRMPIVAMLGRTADSCVAGCKSTAAQRQ